MLGNFWKRSWQWIGRGIGRLFGANFRDNTGWLADWLRQYPTLSGVHINERNVETIACFFQAVNLISGDIGKLPIHKYKGSTNGRERDKGSLTYRLLRRKPCADMTAFAWKRKLTRDVLIYGNAYCLIVRNPDLSPRELIPMDPTNTRPVRDASGKLFYQWREKPGGQWMPLRAIDVLHWRGLSEDGILGMGIADKARESLGLTKAAEQFGAKFFGNGSISSGVLKYPLKLNDEIVARIRHQWEEMYNGDNQHRVAVLEGGTDFTPLTIPPEQAQFLLTRQFQRQEVASWFNLPPHKLGDDSRTSFNSLEQENQAYLDSTLDPWLASLEEELYDKLLLEREKIAGGEIEFLRAALLRPDMKTRYEVYALSTFNGIASRNECRDNENLPPVPGGDVFRVPGNTIDPLAPPPAPAPNPGPPAPPPKKQKKRQASGSRLQEKPVDRTPFRRLVESAIASRIRWEVSAITRFAEKPDTFAAETEKFYGEHRTRMLEALASPIACASAVLSTSIDASLAVDRYIADSKQRLANSRGPITDVLIDWESRAATVASEIIL